MTEDNDSTSDISEIVDQVIESISSPDEINQDEVMSCDITLRNVRGKARISVNAPIAVGTEAVDYINENIDEIIDKDMSTDTGVKIGEMLISGEGEIVEVRIKNKYKNG